MLEIFTAPDACIALLTLTFLEIVSGIDNIIFISITAGKLDKNLTATRSLFFNFDRFYAYSGSGTYIAFECVGQ